MPSPVHEEAFGTFDVPDPCRIDNPALAAKTTSWRRWSGRRLRR